MKSPALTVALVLAAAITGCSANEKPKTPPASTQPSTAATPAMTSHAPLGQATRLNAWEITITGQRARVTSSHYAGVPKGKPVAIITIKLTNRSTTGLPADEIDVQVTAGADGRQAEQVHEFNETDIRGEVAPGRTKTGEYRFVIDKADLTQVQVEVAPGGAGTPTATFEGAIA